MLEVVGIGVATLFEGNRRTPVRIPVDAGVVARQCILAAEGQLAQLVAFEADPRIAVEQDPRCIHLASVEHELAFQLEDDSGKRGPEGVLAGDSPAVAAEPRDLVARLAIAVGVGIADAAQRDVEETIQGDAIGRSHLERYAGAYVVRRGNEPLGCGLRRGAGPQIRKRFLKGPPLLGSSLLRRRLLRRGLLRRCRRIQFLLQGFETQPLRLELRALGGDLGPQIAGFVGGR